MKFIPWLFGIIIVFGALVSFIVAGNGSYDVINPTGNIAIQQKELLYFSSALSLIVVIPVFLLTIFIAHKYNAKKNSKYSPDYDGNNKAEATWWAIPIILIFILSVVTWNTTYSLDPYKAIASNNEPVNIQVVALNYKWLFIYPDYNIATVNELYLPIDRPINFLLTSDAPMTSFWIPSLGTQIYAMKGMQTKLHLISNQQGTVDGKNSNISGEGYADMNFAVTTVDEPNFDIWLNSIKYNSQPLTIYDYENLTKDSIQTKPVYFYNIEPNLFNLIIKKYANHGTH